MSYGVLQEMPGVTEADYKAVERHLGPDRPQGLLAHVSGPADGGWRVINIWESEAAFQRFRSERLLRGRSCGSGRGLRPRQGGEIHVGQRVRQRVAVLMADLTTLRERNVGFWDQAAPGWIRHADQHDALGAPLGAAAMSALDPQPGERIVDVGSGCGGTTRSIAAAVGPSGAAVGVDLSEAMTTAARRRSEGAVFVTADVEASDVIEGAPFDAAYSRMTLMLFADPIAGAATIRRSLRPGGRLAATVFRGPESNAWLASVVLGAAPHLGALPPLPMGDEPGPFAFADPERAWTALTSGGFVNVSVSGVDVEIRTPDTPDAIAEWLIEIGPAGSAYRHAAPSAQAAARSGAVNLLRKYYRAGQGYRLPSGVWLITADVPAI